MTQQFSARLCKDKLWEEGYSLKSLLNATHLQQVYEEFSKLLGITVELVAFPDLDILVAVPWQAVCEKFHRAWPASAIVCNQSNQQFIAPWGETEEIRVIECGLGLSDALAAVRIEGKLLGAVVIGQVFLETPDLSRFQEQATLYGYDAEEYLSAISKIPVIERERLEAELLFLRDITLAILEQKLQQWRSETYNNQLREEIAQREKVEEMLRQSEESYRGLFDSVLEAIYIQARDGSFLDVNRGALEMYGLRREDLIGKTPADVGVPGKNDLEKVKQCFEEALAGKPQRFEFWGRRSTGEEFLKDVRLYKGTYFGQDVVIALASDITDRRREEEKMRRHLKELAVLHAISEMGARAEKIDELISDVTQFIAHTFELDSFGLMFYDPSRQVLVTHPSYCGEFLEDKQKVMVRLGEGITGMVALSRKPCLVPDTLQDERYIAVHPQMRSELCVPLTVSGELIGVLNAESRLPAFFDEDDLRMFVVFSEALATAIQRLRLFEEQQKRLKEAEILRDSTTILTATLEMNELLQIVLDLAARIVPYDSASVVMIEGDSLRIVAAKGLPENVSWADKKFRVNENWKKIIAEKKALIVQDVEVEPSFERWPGTESVRSWMAVPLLARNEVIGGLCMDSHQPNAFNASQAALMHTFANQVVVAIENARLFELEHRRFQEAETLRMAAAALTSTLDQNEAINAILDQLARVVPYDSASVQELKDGYIEIVGGKGWSDPQAVLGMRFPIPGDNPNTVVIQTLKPLLLHDAQAAYSEFRKDVHSHIHSWLGVPLVVRERPIGLLAIDSRHPNGFTEEQVSLITAFANQAAIAMANAKLYQEALEATERRAILHRVSQEIVRIQEDEEKVYETIHRSVDKLMLAEAFVISLVDEENPDEVILIYLYDVGVRWPVSRVPTNASLSGTVIRSGKSVIYHDLQKETIDPVVHFGDSQTVRSILAVPMMLGEKVIGMLSAQSYLPNVYTEEDQILLEMLASYAAIAIRNIRLYKETTQRLSRLETINRISTILRETASTSEILSRLLDETLHFLNSSCGAIWLYDGNKKILVQSESRGWFQQVHGDIILPDEGLVGRAFLQGEIIFSPDLSQDIALPLSEQARAVGWSGLAVPIRSLQEGIGVLVVAVELPRQIPHEDTHLLYTISEIAGNAIRRSQLFQQTQHQLQRLSSLRTIDIAINTILDLRVILNILIEHILAQLNVDAAAILLLNPRSQTLQHAASAGFNSEAPSSWQFYVANDITTRVIRSRSMFFVRDLRDMTQRGRLLSLADEKFVTYCCVPLVAKGQIKGVLELYNRSPLEPDAEWKNILETLADQTAIAVDNALLFEELQKMNINLLLAYDAAIEGWAKALDLRSYESPGHTQRLAERTVKLASALGVPENDLVYIRRGALLHDIGMMGIPDTILSKLDPLTEEEWALIRRHPQIAQEMLSMIAYLQPALEIPYSHHERWNGSGYPRGLEGEEIPLAARIFAVVDVWDALTSDRPYRKAWTREAAREYLEQNKGILFDPRVVDVFLRLIDSESAL